MKKLSVPGILLILGLVSCQAKQEYFTKEQLLKKSDSLTAIRFEELQKQAAEDLDHRISIEVKPKVDSILEDVELVLPANEMLHSVEPNMFPSGINMPDRDTAKKDSL